MTAQLQLAVAPDGCGWDRQAWRATVAADPDTPGATAKRCVRYSACR